MAMDSRVRSFFLLNVNVLSPMANTGGTDMAGYTRLPSAFLSMKPKTSLTFESVEFRPYTPEYTVVKPDSKMKFIDV